MTIDEHEGIKNRVAKILNYYGFEVYPEWKLPNNRRIDLVVKYSNEILIGIEIELTGNLRDDIDRLTSLDLNHRFIITSSHFNNITSGKSYIEVFSINNLLSFEDRIRSIINATNKPRFKEIEVAIEDNSDCPALIYKFDNIIEKSGFNVDTIHNIIYNVEVSSSIPGRPYLPENNLDIEYKFLISLGLWDWDYIESRDKSRWIRTRYCIVKQRLMNYSEEIKEIIESHSMSFNYIALVGTLGYISYYNNYQQGIAISPNQNFKEYSSLINISINSQYWLRKICEIEVKKTLEYYKQWIDRRIGILANRIISIPLVLLLKEKIIDISLWDDYNRADLQKFSLWSILKDMRYDYNREMKNIQGEESYRPLIEETSKFGYTSELLPEGAKELFSIYDKDKFEEYCNNKMHEYARKIYN